MDLVAATLSRLQALRDEQDKPVFVDVLDVLELGLIIEQGNPKRDRTAYVLMNSEMPMPAVLGSGPSQQCMVMEVAVVIALKATNSALASNTNLQEIRRQVKAALFDWTPDGDQHQPFTRGPSRPLAFRNGWIYWVDTFRSDTWE